jgi:thiol-disulfide isomerase/thioredoxin
MGREALFDAYMKQARLDEARATLAEMERLLPHDSAQGLGESAEHESRHLTASWSSRRAALAQAEGQTVDALLYYHAALTLDPMAPDSPRDAAAELWQELGAGEKALRSWSTAGTEPKLPFGEPKVLELPDFELQDLDGRTWSLSELRGKAVLINVWAAWCGPCLFELPWLQKLHDRVRDRPDLVVLSLNVDQNPGVVEPIMRRNGYDFPVVFAFQYMFDLWGPQWAIPCTWIVDPQGTVRREQSGFGASDERWLADVMHAMEQVAQYRD